MKYRVDITESFLHTTIVEADSREEAREVAYQQVMNSVDDERIITTETNSLGSANIETYEEKEN